MPHCRTFAIIPINPEAHIAVVPAAKCPLNETVSLYLIGFSSYHPQITFTDYTGHLLKYTYA